MDYVKDGSRLLTSVFDEYDFDEIKDLKVLDKFLARLLEVTNGMLIVDFLDSVTGIILGAIQLIMKMK